MHPPLKKSFFLPVLLEKLEIPFYRKDIFHQFFFYFVEHIPAHIPVSIYDIKIFLRFFMNFLILKIPLFLAYHKRKNVTTFRRSSFTKFPDTGIEIETSSLECKNNYLDCINQ